MHDRTGGHGNARYRKRCIILPLRRFGHREDLDSRSSVETRGAASPFPRFRAYLPRPSEASEPRAITIRQAETDLLTANTKHIAPW